MPVEMRFGAVVLAAGASVRMGEPKQLLRIGGKPLVTRAAEAVRDAGAQLVVVVVGAEVERIREAVSGLMGDGRVLLAENPGWGEGMGSSLRCGLSAVERLRPGLEGVLFALCDQPAFDEAVARRLAQAWSDPSGVKTIAAAAYGGKVGAPALFGRVHFPELMALGGDEGARSVLKRHTKAIAEVPWPSLAVDLDKPEEFRAWIAGGENE